MPTGPDPGPPRVSSVVGSAFGGAGAVGELGVGSGGGSEDVGAGAGGLLGALDDGGEVLGVVEGAVLEDFGVPVDGWVGEPEGFGAFLVVEREAGALEVVDSDGWEGAFDVGGLGAGAVMVGTCCSE